MTFLFHVKQWFPTFIKAHNPKISQYVLAPLKYFKLKTGIAPPARPPTIRIPQNLPLTMYGISSSTFLIGEVRLTQNIYKPAFNINHQIGRKTTTNSFVNRFR